MILLNNFTPGSMSLASTSLWKPVASKHDVETVLSRASRLCQKEAVGCLLKQQSRSQVGELVRHLDVAGGGLGEHALLLQAQTIEKRCPGRTISTNQYFFPTKKIPDGKFWSLAESEIFGDCVLHVIRSIPFACWQVKSYEWKTNIFKNNCFPHVKCCSSWWQWLS